MKKKIVTGVALFLIFGPLALQAADDIKESGFMVRKGIYQEISQQATRLYHPFMLYEQDSKEKGGVLEQLLKGIADSVPFHYFAGQESEDTCVVEVIDFEKIIEEQEKYGYENAMEEQELAQAVLEENQKVEEMIKIETKIPQEIAQQEEAVAVVNTFVPQQQRQATYVLAQLQSTDFIKKTFYTEDATTLIQPNQIKYDMLMGYDATLKQGVEAPQILIYHTHSQEGYIDSTQDASTTILGVGEHLSEILRKEYGFNVLHHMGQYDVASRDDAYANAAIGLEEVLNQNPSIEVIIDLHRDAVAEGEKLVTTIQGQEMAQFMFFNGLSYTKAKGELTSLPNPYIQENLSFAFQMKYAADEYYPGLTRKTYLKGYRYNMQYRPKSLLIELGAQTNTVEEAMNACRPLAHIISMVLKGENKQ